MVISESSLLLNTRDVIQGAAVHECPWASKFLLNLGAAFSNWIKVSRVGVTPIMADREFFKYLPNFMHLIIHLTLSFMASSSVLFYYLSSQYSSPIKPYHSTYNLCLVFISTHITIILNGFIT